MKRFASVILFICLCAQCLVQPAIVAWYNINKEYVTARYCENKAKPGMHCDGKCYLKKQLKKTEDNRQSGSRESKSEQLQLAVYILPERWAPQQVFTESGVVYTDGYIPVFITHTLEDIFHPPRSLHS